jgi:hypothetical protein
VVEGRITERIDFGEYIESLGRGNEFDGTTASTREVADRALRAYLDGDLDTQAELFAPDIQFQDPTSRVYGPPSGQLYQGADELLRRRRQIYPGVSDFNRRDGKVTRQWDFVDYTVGPVGS